MNIMAKKIGLLMTALLLTACVHHGYGRGYSNNGYYPGNGNQGFGNYYPYHRQPYNQARPQTYGYGYGRPNNSNNYYNQNNYYNRPQPPRPMYGYGNNGYQQHQRDDDHGQQWDNHDGHREHHSHWER